MGILSFFSGSPAPVRRGNVFFPEGAEAAVVPFGAEQRSSWGADLSTTDPRLLEMLGLNAGSVHVSAESALRLARVFRCVDLISSTFAGLPWELREKLPTGGSRPASNHPNARLYFSPEAGMRAFAWKKLLCAHALLQGDGYAKITRNGIGRVTGAKVYAKHKVRVQEFEGRLWYTFDKDTTPTADYDVIHFKPFTTDGLTGRTPIQMGAESLGVSLQAQRFAHSFLQNGARVSGVFLHEDPKGLTPAAKQNLKDSWAPFEGAGNGGKTAILEYGLKYQQLGIPPGDAKLLELLTVTDEQICAWFGVPQPLAGILGNTSYNSLEYLDLQFAKYTLSQYVTGFQQEFDFKTLRSDELGTFYTHFNFNALLRADTEKRGAFYRMMRGAGVMNANEIRDLEDMNGYEGGDEYLVQGANVPHDLLRQVYTEKLNQSGTSNLPNAN